RFCGHLWLEFPARHRHHGTSRTRHARFASTESKHVTRGSHTSWQWLRERRHGSASIHSLAATAAGGAFAAAAGERTIVSRPKRSSFSRPPNSPLHRTRARSLARRPSRLVRRDAARRATGAQRARAGEWSSVGPAEWQL